MKPLPVEGHVPKELLEPLRGKRVLITGHEGFVGRWMHETLVSSGVDAQVIGQGRNGWLIPLPDFDYCVHCTTDGGGIDYVAQRARRCGGKVLYLSSGAVYGTSKDRKPFAEADRANPETEYASLKACHEYACRDVAVARLFSFIGPGLRRHVGREFLEADPIQVKGDGAVRAFMYAGDMARWLWTILLRGEVGRAYNVGGDYGVYVADFAIECARYRKVKVEVDYSAEQTGTYYVPNTDLCHNELGLRCEVGLTEAVQRTLEWQRG